MPHPLKLETYTFSGQSSKVEGSSVWPCSVICTPQEPPCQLGNSYQALQTLQSSEGLPGGNVLLGARAAGWRYGSVYISGEIIIFTLWEMFFNRSFF